MTLRRAILWGLLFLSCAPHSPSTSKAPPKDAPPYGDAIDDAAWEALGPRPPQTPRLPYGGAMRLVDFWLLDENERSGRMAYAAIWTQTAEQSEVEQETERLDFYLDAIRLAPLYLPAWAHACRVLIDRQELARAMALAKQYARLTPPGDGMPFYILGKCHAQLGEPEKALELYEEAAATYSTTQTDVLESMALVYLQLGNLPAAESLQTMYDIRDPSLDLLIRARRARVDGDLHQSVTLLQKATTTPGAPAGTWEELASVHFSLGELEAAAQAYRRSIQEIPTRVTPLIGLARVQNAQGDHTAAEKTLQEVLRQEPGNLAAQFNLAVVLLGRARTHEPMSPASTNDLVRAEQSWSLCIKKSFHLEEALWGRAETSLRRDHLSSAQFDAQQLRELSHEVAAVHVRWAELLIVTGLNSVALEALREAARHQELDRQGRALLAQLEDKSGADALPLLREAFRENPQDPQIGMRLGVALLNKGDLEGAESVLRAVVALGPDDPDAYQNLAAVLDRRQKYREAQAALLKAESLR